MDTELAALALMGIGIVGRRDVIGLGQARLLTLLCSITDRKPPCWIVVTMTTMTMVAVITTLTSPPTTPLRSAQHFDCVHHYAAYGTDAGAKLAAS